MLAMRGPTGGWWPGDLVVDAEPASTRRSPTRLAGILQLYFSAGIPWSTQKCGDLLVRHKSAGIFW